MAVPMLNYATMPVVQPPSEMQGFSNALLQAGALRQDRLKAEQARADQLQQTQFNQNIATQQLGLQQKADARAEQAQQWQGKRHEMDMARLQAEAMQRKKDEASKQWLSMPENAKRYAELEAKGDELGKLALLEEGFIATNNFDSDKLMKVGDQRLQVLEALDAAETNALTRAKHEMDMAYTKLKMAGERMKQAAPMGGLDPKVLGSMQDNIMSQIREMNGNLQRAKSEQGTYGKLIASKPTVEGLKSTAAGLDPQSQAFAEAQRIIRMFDGKPSDEAQARMIADELRQLNALVDNRQKEIDYYEQKAGPELTAQLSALQQAQVPGLVAVSVIPTQEWMRGSQVAPAPERSWMDEARDAIFGSPDTGSGYIPGSVQRRETPPSTTFKAKGDAMNLPTSDGPRPSKASTTAAQTAPRYVDPAERNRRIQEISGKIQDIEKALPGLDMASEIYGPMNQRIRENSERELARLRIQLKEAEDLLPIQRTSVSSGRAFTGVY
jgi:hypothetical protein